MRLIIVTAAWALGISLARVFPAIDIEVYAIAIPLLAAFALVLRGQAMPRLCFLLACLLAGAARLSLVAETSEIAAFNGYSGTVTGTIIAEPTQRTDRLQLRLDVDSVFVNNRVLPTSGLVLAEAFRIADVDYGDRVRATGALEMPSAGDRFSYADYLARQGVFTVMRPAALERVSSGHGSPVLAALLELKGEVSNLIADALPEPQAGLLTGILLGDESGIAPELEDAFERVGASHIVAISGFNMVIVSAIVLRVFSGAFGERRSAATICAVAVIGMYSLFVGASPGILRAALMSSLLVIGNQLRRNTFLPTSLAFATLLLSFFDPNVLLDLGFQLSFCAVLGLGIFADPLSMRFQALLQSVMPLRYARPLHSFLNEPLIVSVAAQLATLPLIVLYFGRLSLAALPVNLLIVPAQSAVLLLGFAAVALYAFAPAIGLLLFWLELICLSWTIGVVRAFSQWEHAEVLVDFDGRLIQIYYILLIGFAMLRVARPSLWIRFAVFVRHRVSVLVGGGLAIAALVLMWAMLLSRPDRQLHVWFLDVGHNNAALIQTPGGAQILVDGGRYPARLLSAIGDRLPFYDREIELLAITQPDEWDIAALSAVLERYSVAAWLYHGQDNRGGLFNELRARLERSGAQYIEAQSGWRFDFDDGATIEILHPPDKPSISDKVADKALVLRVAFGDAGFLLTSDLSADGQRNMLQRGSSPLAAVMQVPQHGTVRALDAEFLKRVQPQAAVLQVDPANRRGDPYPDTLDQLAGLRIFRTDELGTIHFRTDGKTLYVD